MSGSTSEAHIYNARRANSRRLSPSLAASPAFVPPTFDSTDGHPHYESSQGQCSLFLVWSLTESLFVDPASFRFPGTLQGTRAAKTSCKSRWSGARGCRGHAAARRLIAHETSACRRSGGLLPVHR